MAKQLINVGTSPNSRTGDTLRTAFIKINENFDEVYESLFALTGSTNPDTIVDLNIRGSVYAQNGVILLDAVTGKLNPTALPTSVPATYKFNARFDNLGNLLAIDGLPAGWTASVSNNLATVIHPVGRLPVTISYWGYQNNGDFRLRFPTPGYQAVCKSGSDFRLELFLTAATTGADENQFAIITVVI
jgi:hypothetical protein